MISKELLSVVINKKIVVDDISNIELKENTITFIEDYWDEDEGSGFYRSHTINIYELAHKCKEWAYTNNFNILTYKISNSECDSFILHKNATNFKNVLKSFYHIDTEHEAIFKACQWILDNVKTNSLS